MVKGVNKNIIEVNNTGSDIFERIVFYVSPEYGALGADSLKKAEREIEKVLNDGNDNESFESLRSRVKRKSRRIKLISLLLIGATLITVLVCFIATNK